MVQSMDPLSKEVSPSPSLSNATSSKGFKGVVAKARLGRSKDDSAAASINGSDDGSTEHSDIRQSIDSLVDRVRDSRKTSVIDDGLPPGPSNLSKLIPGRAKKKRRKREEAEQQLQQELAEGRGRSVTGDQPATAAEPSQLSKDNRSRSTLGEDGGSLITLDSEDTES